MEFIMQKLLSIIVTVFFLTTTAATLLAATDQTIAGGSPCFQAQEQNLAISTTKEQRKLRVKKFRKFLKERADQEC
jgi:hypothetical protein